MIKILHTRDCMEGFFRMALFAILAEFVLVHILVATGAISKRDTCKLLEFFAVQRIRFMAFDTLYSLVFPGQGIFCPVVTEFNGGYELIHTVTIRAS
jgi:hypothetical protein